MAFTYSDDLSTDRDKVRFYVQDTVESAGPKPADANFSNAELDALITTEGSWERAVAGAFEALATAWARHVTFSADGVSMSRSNIATQHAAQAAIWRKRYGHPGPSSAVTLIHTDQYTDDGSEYT